MASSAANNNSRLFTPDGYSSVSLTHPENVASNEPSPSSAYPHPFSRQSVDQNDNGRGDSFSVSVHSSAPLAPRAATEPVPIMPGMPLPNDYSQTSTSRSPVSQSRSGLTHRTQNSSWDLLAGLRKEAGGYDTRNASEAHLRFAQGDMPNTKFTRIYNYLLNASIITRWTLFIVPVMALLWIPGILGLTNSPNSTIWHVKLLWWSIWFSVVWGGWWGSLALARVLPQIARHTIGLVAVGTRRYIDWLEVLVRYVALFGWSLLIWVTYQPLIRNHVIGESTEISFIANLLFGIFLCASLLLFEKFAIQWIAGKFHERSYAERIADQKIAIKVLVTLYSHSSELSGRPDTLKDRDMAQKPAPVDPRQFLKKALKGVRSAATTTTTALGNVASEIAGSSVLQPNSPQAMVQTALRSANKTRLLARRLFYSFCQAGADALVLTDIAPFFPSHEASCTAFGLFDRDANGDVTREEVELACLDVHREQLSIEHSMRDLDSAVGRLDNILMTLYVVIAALIIIVALDREFVSLLTGAGAFILGLSWLIGGSLQEVLSSIIFLFMRHPYDVGDRVGISKDIYTVKEIRLLSTIFLDSNNCLVQAPNAVLTTLLIHNMRRSPQMSETFEFDVAYDTTFEQIEQLRTKMLAFVRTEGRDFLPSFDVIVKDIPEQEKMTLSADIKYKSNWQQGGLKVKRRNKWICALKTSLGELKIFGPTGDPDAEAAPKMYTEIPWEEVKRKEEEKRRRDAARISVVKSEYDFADRSAAAMANEDVFGEAEQMYMPTPIRGLSEGSVSMSSSGPSRVNSAGVGRVGMPGPPPPMPLPRAPETYEMGSAGTSRYGGQGSTSQV